jgi:glutamate/tyrosine decarboxylase-like PLP-dependent enzyme
MIQDDIALARYLYDLAARHPELEAITHNLSITTLRYVPRELRDSLGSGPTEDYLNQLNQRLLAAIEASGEAFASNAVIAGKYALRFCIVNFRAAAGDMEAIPQLIARLGRQVHSELSSNSPQFERSMTV